MVKKLLELPGSEQYPETFRCMLLGGGPAPKPLLETAKEKHVPVFQSYGMTETASQIVTLSPQDALEKIGSAGKPLFPAQLKIAATETGQVGEIHVKGPMVTGGYFKNKAATDSSFREGWLATGDLGYTDAEGFMYVVDRRNDLIISGGENIYPSEIESVLYEMEEISEAGITGIEDGTWGQVPAAFIVKNTESLSAEDVLAYARRYLAAYKIPKQIYFTDQLPRNASNKLMRHKLAEWLQ
jgi:O-succinylbenzoic acid--CoA ligase